MRGYWREIQLDFELDRTIINLNNGYTSPAPRVVLESEQRFHWKCSTCPLYFYQLPFEERIQTIRVRMAHGIRMRARRIGLDTQR